MTQSFQEVVAYIGNNWHCDETKYPVMEKMSDEQRLMFVINHLVLHMSKSVGKIAAQCESFDHGNDIYRVNRDELELLAAKMVINVLQFSHVLGMDGEKIIQAVHNILDHNKTTVNQ